MLCIESATTVRTVVAGKVKGEDTLGRTGTKGGGDEAEDDVEFFDEPAVAGGGTIASTISEDF